MSFSWGVVAGCFIGPYIRGLYGKNITRPGAWAGLLSGISVVGILLTVFTVSGSFETAKSMAPVFGLAAIAASVITVPLVSKITANNDVSQ